MPGLPCSSTLILHFLLLYYPSHIKNTPESNEIYNIPIHKQSLCNIWLEVDGGWGGGRGRGLGYMPHTGF